MSILNTYSRGAGVVVEDLIRERVCQDVKWGEQNHPDGTGGYWRARAAEAIRARCERVFARGDGTWQDILEEEVAEAFAETDPVRLREELIQVAAVAMAWVEAIDRRAVKR